MNENEPVPPDALRRLDELSRLPATEARFTAEDVLVRAGRTRPRARWSWAAAAAAVFLLAVTHAAAFLFGQQQAKPPLAVNPVDETERVLREMAALDVAAPHEKLARKLIDLRGELEQRLPYLRSDEVPAADRPRAETFANIVGQVEVAFEEVDDPGFRALAVRKLAGQALGGRMRFALIPASTESYRRVTPLGDGRYQVIIVHDGRPRVASGTIEEIEARHPGLEIRVEGE